MSHVQGILVRYLTCNATQLYSTTHLLPHTVKNHLVLNTTQMVSPQIVMLEVVISVTNYMCHMYIVLSTRCHM